MPCARLGLFIRMTSGWGSLLSLLRLGFRPSWRLAGEAGGGHVHSALAQEPMTTLGVSDIWMVPLCKGASLSPSPKDTQDPRPSRRVKPQCQGAGRAEEEGPAGGDSGCACPPPQILISADDEMEESDAEEDLRRLTPLKPAKKKKHRFGLPV